MEKIGLEEKVNEVFRNRPKGLAIPANGLVNHKNPFSQNFMHNHLNPEILIGVSRCLLASMTGSDQEHTHGASVIQSFNRNFVLRPLNSDLDEESDFSGHTSAFDQSKHFHQSTDQQNESMNEEPRLSGCIIKSAISNETISGNRFDRKGLAPSAEIRSQLNCLIPVEEWSQLSQKCLERKFYTACLCYVSVATIG